MGNGGLSLKLGVRLWKLCEWFYLTPNQDCMLSWMVAPVDIKSTNTHKKAWEHQCSLSYHTILCEFCANCREFCLNPGTHKRLHGRHQQPILWPLLSQPPNQNPSIKATSHINIKNQIPCNPHKYMSVEHPWIIFLCNHVSHGGFLCMSMVHYTYIWQRYGAGPGNWTNFLANSAQTAANSIQLTHPQTAPLRT